jgi:urease accessory protein
MEQQHDSLSTYRLFQLISPSLPIGGFTYSQGLEWAVEAGWVTNRQSMQDWLGNMLFNSVATLELPVIDKFYHALQSDDLAALIEHSQLLYSSRETKELRAEERQRGLALATLLKQLGIEHSSFDHPDVEINQLLGLCIAARHWQISRQSLKQGYLWSWAENLVMAGVKLVPLGQTDGQRALMTISDSFPQALSLASQTEEWMIGSFTPSISIASSLHETQYTRLFRS